ncbi:unnamed protein product [Adineta steineri]|uniref:Uncharacterized protein n=1 Tax=Adineta steineri TaxID=433720 RepID=A0A814T486_9BILA|nr:unnamed protein product [Adineta steineri]CAF3642401.1 unnamed protein product [Adineta steineri]
MGGLLNRSSTQRDEGKTKLKKDKRKRRHDDSDAPLDNDDFVVIDRNENEDPQAELVNPYELWNNKCEQKPIMNINVDPPGAPRTDSPNYFIHPNDAMNHPWSSSLDVNNSFYPLNSLQSVSQYNMPYDPNQYMHNQFSNSMNNQLSSSMGNQSPRLASDGRVPKRVHFSSLHPEQQQQQQQQQQPMPLKPLTNAHSWHETNTTAFATSTSTGTKPMRLSNRSSSSRPSVVKRRPTPTQVPVQKPIYVGVDHQATLAERGQIIANTHHRRNDERNLTNTLTSSMSNQQFHSHTNHQNKHQKISDSPNSDNRVATSRSFDVSQTVNASSHRSIIKSMSTNRIPKHSDQIPFIPNETKPLRTRSARRQESPMNNELKPLRSRENFRQHTRQHPSNQSPLSLSNDLPNRRIQRMNSGSPVLRIALSKGIQHQQRQQMAISGVNHTMRTIPRTRS